MELMIAVAILAILVAIALPNMAAHRKTTQMMTCLSNLDMLNRATAAYIIKNNSADNIAITMEMLVPQGDADKDTQNKYFIRYMPKCPTGGSYSYQQAQHEWKCSLGGDSEANGGYPHSRIR